MTQQELDQIPEANPNTDRLGVIFLADDEPTEVVDKDGAVWSFAKDMETGNKVKVRS